MSHAVSRVVTAVVATVIVVTGALAAVTYRTVLRATHDADGLLVTLIVGSDSGPPYRPGDPLRGRADAIHIVAVDDDTRRATVVDIPRDAVIGGTKVNAHLATGGPETLVSQLETFTGLTIDYWMLTTFRGFERLTSVVGAVEVEVEVPMHDPASGSDFEPGPTHVSGRTALAYARDRHSLPDGDFGRTRHQGELLVALHRRLVADSGDLPQVVDHMATVVRTTASNVPLAEMLPLALLAVAIDPADVEHVSLTGQVDTLGDASVVRVDPGDTFTRIADGIVGPPG